MPTCSSNMAASTKKKADTAKSFVRPGTKKQVLKKTKELSSSMKYPATIINTGMSSCAQCNDVDKSNMLECCQCERWYHGKCQSLKYSTFMLYHENPEDVPYVCRECRSFLASHYGKLLKTVHEEKWIKLTQAEIDISLLQGKLSAVEQQNIFDENLKFQEAVNKQIEKYIQNIKNEFKEMEENFEKASVKTTADSGGYGYQCRKKRIVLFGMPNTLNDLETVQQLFDELELGRMDIQKIFRINFNTNDSSIAPPLNVEFISIDDKWKMMNKNTREKLKSIPSSSLFCGVSVAPDRSYQERQKYRQLRGVMNQRNNELVKNGLVNEVWIIRKMSLEKVKVKQDEE